MPRKRQDPLAPLRGLGDLESVLASIIEGTSDVVWIKDAEGTYVMVNEAFGVFAGHAPADIIGRQDRDLFSASDTAIFLETDRRVLESGQPFEFESQVELGGVRTTHLVTKSAVRDRSGAIVGVVGIAHDITALRQAERARAESEQRFQRIVETSPDGIWVHRGGITLFTNRTMAEIVGAASPADLIGRSVWDFVLPDDVTDVRARIDGAEQGRSAPAELRTLRRLDGSTIRTDVAVEPIVWDGQAAVQAVVRDVSARVAAQEALRESEERHAQRLLHDAMHDALTGLPNRALFMEELRLAVDRYKRRPGYGFTVLFLDLDRFKVINDSLGHLAGDALLVELAARLQRCLRPGDRVARLGGDEFTILLDDIDDVASATRIADRIQAELETPFIVSGREMFSSASIGIALSSTGYHEPEAVLRDADLAMYRAKGRGGARYEVFDLGMHASAVTRLELETDLRRAVERAEFRLVYQPVYTVEGDTLIGFEALLRWQHPKRGLMDPGAFIEIAEETNLTVIIGRWVIEEACRQLAQWQAASPDHPVSIAVNVSGRQLLGAGLVQEVARALLVNDVAPSRLFVEITENVLMEDADIAADVLNALKVVGVRLFMDDFGTGYSSLSYLRRFPLDGLKIDRFFVSRMDERENLELVRTIVALARNLGLSVVAEGVENAEQLALLKAMGCSHVQGFLMAQPMSPEEAGSLLERLRIAAGHTILQT